MAYVDYDYYSGEFQGKLVQGEIDKLLEEASDEIDKLTYGRIRGKGFNNLTEYQQGLIKKAVCYQAEFLSTYGEYLSSPLGSFSVGDVSLSFKDEKNGVVASKKTLDYLNQTGLMSRRL